MPCHRSNICPYLASQNRKYHEKLILRVAYMNLKGKCSVIKDRKRQVKILQT